MDSNHYTYKNFMYVFNIDVDMFEKSNETTDKKKEIIIILFNEKINEFEQKKIKMKSEFEAVVYYNITTKGKENILNMDLLYNNDYIFKDARAQTFIFITGIILNMKCNMSYDYNTINFTNVLEKEMIVENGFLPLI